MVDKPDPLPESVELVATLDDFTRQYLVTALWAEHDNSDPDTGGDPFDKNYDLDDLDPDVLRDAIRDCADFQQRCRPALRDAFLQRDPDGSGALSMAGHDFWLTRNGHGAGFGDGDWVYPVDGLLGDIARTYSQVDLYLGDDGRIYS